MADTLSMANKVKLANGKTLRIKSARKIQAEDRAFWAASSAPLLTPQAAAVVREAVATWAKFVESK